MALAKEKLLNSEKMEFVAYRGEESSSSLLAKAITHPHPITQLLLSSKLSVHIPEAGLNPIVDAAAYLFSMMGKIKSMKNCTDLPALHRELVQEIETFQEVLHSFTYRAEYLTEYIPIACYALCVSFDDIILNTSWGGPAKWQEYNLVTAFIPDAPAHMSFFVILERLVRDPDIYIDIMEFMYICLSLGFQCGYNSKTTEFNHEQLKQIMNSLYKRIRAYRQDFTKILSPYSNKSSLQSNKFSVNNIPLGLTILLTCSISILLFTGGAYLLSRLI